MRASFQFKNFVSNIVRIANRHIVQRGIRVYHESTIRILDLDDEYLSGILEVQSSTQRNVFYTVVFETNKVGDILCLTCNCRYAQENEVCKHIIGSVMFLQYQPVNKGDFKNGNVLFVKELKDALWKANFNKATIQKAHLLVNKRHVHIENNRNGQFSGKVSAGNDSFSISIHQAKKSSICRVSCSCGTEKCLHILAGLMMLEQEHGKYALQRYYNWDDEKEQIIEETGVSPEAVQNHFDWRFADNHIVLAWKNDDLKICKSFPELNAVFSTNNIKSDLEKQKYLYQMAYGIEVYDAYDERFSFAFNTFLVKLGKGNQTLKTGSIMPEDALHDELWLQHADTKDKSIYHKITELGTVDFYSHTMQERRKLYALFKEIIALAGNKPFFYFKEPVRYYNKRSAKKELLPLGNKEVHIKVRCIDYKDIIKISQQFYIDDEEVFPDFTGNEVIDELGLFVKVKNQYYLWRSVEDQLLSELLGSEKETGLGTKKWNDFFNKIIKPFINQVDIQVNTAQIHIEAMANAEIGEKKLILSEVGNFLLVYPVVKYNDIEVNVLENGENYLTQNNKLIKRDKEFESEMVQQVSATHPSFSPDTNQEFFHIPIERIMENNWFLNMYTHCKEQNISIYGLDKLRKIKYSPAHPTISYNVSSGTDWFDITIDIDYEGQKVPLKALRKAIINNTNLVQLDDGKFGILPEEWLKKIGATLRFGKLHDNKVEMRKSQFALINDLYDEINNPEILEELAERRTLLNNGATIEKVPKPRALKGKLRSYQQEGLNWLVFLQKLGLGGCLADDMGLGKTIQMIAFIIYLKQKKGKQFGCALVVCPTTLLFNWEKELQKFAPSLKYHVHWGTSRQVSTGVADHNDVVLTTYGTLANDIEHMRTKKFDVVVLDESQAIKNPESLRYKAVNLLKSENRFVMTGTPIENNVTELFAQMQFINPGLLGNLNAFRKEYAGSIDKDRDANKTNDLRRLVQPFILRRTKEVVAKELPEKTEQVYLCEMGKAQREVYDAFKDDIREKLMTSIEEEGLAKTRFTILEGLTKMRQICDSPAILSTQEGYGNDSVKADELIEMLKEKMHQHKALVFSQFLGMLSLIEQRLQQAGISYVKLTGQTRNREDVVKAFEQDENCKVFLISLKAGGTGLNLVSADYVFLVDPWWNPAVENQAIDRAHRIGQNKKVFAYRMICKDTVEEKILALQERKRTLSDELISSDQSFVSSLSSEDIKELFG